MKENLFIAKAFKVQFPLSSQIQDQTERAQDPIHGGETKQNGTLNSYFFK